MKKGFTLIELLVVISIIGLLSSVVLSSLSSARNKGATVAVKATMRQIANQAALYRSSNSSFNSTGLAVSSCSAASTLFSDPIVQSQETNTLANAAPGAALSCFINSVGTEWAISVSALKTGGTWCVDNSGNIGAGVAQASGKCN